MRVRCREKELDRRECRNSSSAVTGELFRGWKKVLEFRVSCSAELPSLRAG